MPLAPDPPLASDKSVDRLVHLFQSEGDELLERRPPWRARATLALLTLMLVGFFTLAELVQIDRVVTSSHGQLVTVDPNLIVQPLDPSIVKSIGVREGDLVRAGQRLASLDPTLAAADVNALRSQVASFLAEIARCEAELAEKPLIYSAAAAPGETDYGAMQLALYEQRRAQFAAQIKAYAEQINLAHATVVKFVDSRLQSEERLVLANRVEKMWTDLESKNSGSQLQTLTSHDSTVQLRQTIDLDQDSIQETQHSIAATESMRDAFIQQWRAQLSQELVQSRILLETARQSLEKAIKHQDLVVIDASADALVLHIAKVSVGSVLQPAETLMELAPLNSTLEADILIDPLQIGFVRPGDPVILKLDPYNFVEHGTLSGELRWVSQGTFSQTPVGTAGAIGALTTAGPDSANIPSENAGGSSAYYRARIVIKSVDLHDVPPDFRLLPGTTLAADVHVGTRSLFWYLVRGLVRGMDESMREP